MIVLTTANDDATVLGALRAGASGLLLKDTAPMRMLEAIQVVAAGEALFDPRVTRQVIEGMAAPSAAMARLTAQVLSGPAQESPPAS